MNTTKLREMIAQVLLVFLAMMLITCGIWGTPQNLVYRHLFLDSMMVFLLMKRPFSKKNRVLADIVDFTLAARPCSCASTSCAT